MIKDIINRNLATTMTTYIPVIHIAKTSGGEAVILRHRSRPRYAVEAYSFDSTGSKRLIVTDDLVEAAGVLSQMVELCPATTRQERFSRATGWCKFICYVLYPHGICGENKMRRRRTAQKPLLFTKGSLSNYLRQWQAKLEKEIEAYGPDDILNVSEEDFCRDMISEYSLDPPELHDDQIYVYNQSEIDIDVSQDPMRYFTDRHRPYYEKGTKVTIAVPFDGDGELFQHSPSTSRGPLKGATMGQELHLIYEILKPNSQQLEQMYKKELGDIRFNLNYVKQDIEKFNSSLESFVRQTFAQRKKKLQADLGMVEALGIPIKRRDDLPKTYSVPTLRRKPAVARPQATAEPFKPEPILNLEEYKYILKVISDMAMAMERSPHCFCKLQEEEIRNFFLIFLNGHYEGQATGETFNYKGKTDILIRHEGKNAFIAECKFWKGPAGLRGTIDQLLDYTSWRDTKTAILLFNKNRNFSSVLEKIDTAVRGHPNYKRKHKLEKANLNDETTYTYIFHQPGDVNRELVLTVMAFDIPKPEDQ